MGEPLNISDTCLERLEAWLKAHCKAVLEDREFVGGMLFIIDEEVKEAMGRARREAIERMTLPREQ